MTQSWPTDEYLLRKGDKIEANVSIDIPEMGSVCVTVDLDWTMEAVMNLMKNCMEASPPKTTVHCYYEENPLYVQIQIWDEGQGFEKEELPHLFERFYRGKHGADSGIGIGLSMAKSIIIPLLPLKIHPSDT